MRTRLPPPDVKFQLKSARFIGVCLLLFVAACSSRASDPKADAQKLGVQECDAYARQLSLCTGDASAPTSNAREQAAALLGADDTQRQKMAAICARDLERLKRSCR